MNTQYLSGRLVIRQHGAWQSSMADNDFRGHGWIAGNGLAQKSRTGALPAVAGRVGEIPTSLRDARCPAIPDESFPLFVLAVSEVALGQLYKIGRGFCGEYGLAYLVEPADFRNVRVSSGIRARCAF